MKQIITPTHYHWFPVKVLLFVLLALSEGFAFTNIQTSTSFGTFKDYKKIPHYQLFNSWSLKGINEAGLETSIEFYINNDFTENEWSFNPTQAQITYPFTTFLSSSSDVKSEIKVGRQLYTEGFDLALLDGLQVPLRWDKNAGVMPILGQLSSTDFDQAHQSSAPLVGLVIWDSFADLKIRAGGIARDKDLSEKFIFASGQYTFETVLWQPSLFAKQEWFAEDFKFNQNVSEIAAHFSESLDGRLAYSNLDPRPTNKIDADLFVYRLFSISPTETAAIDLTWTMSESLILSLGAEKAYYNSGYLDEVSEREDISMDYQFSEGQWLSPCLTWLRSYGGDVKDLGVRYTYDISTTTKFMTEFDNAYLKKINQIEGWAQHLRSTYEFHFWNRAKFGLALEVERNHYYQFDARTMVYVTNYL